MKPYLSIIIPAYNEAERLPLALVDIDKYLSSAPYSYEILVVNDGSTDDTALIVKNMMNAVKGLKLIDNRENRGKGSAVRQGMLLARGEIRLFTDADQSTSIDHLEKVLPFLTDADGLNYDVVLGSRGLKESRMNPPQPFYRRILGKGGNLIAQLIAVRGIWDTQCGFKAFTADAAEKIFSLANINGWGFDIETLALARALGYRVKEIPVRWANSRFSHVRGTAYLKTLLEVFTIRWWLMTDAYGIWRMKRNNAVPRENRG